MYKILNALLSLCFIAGVHSQTVDFTFQSANGSYCTPATILFTQTCTGNPVSFTWDFGNNERGYNGTETITYAAPGSFTVKLTATFSNTILSVTKTIVVNPAIKSFITVDRDSICLPGVINFTGSVSGSIANYQWNFGDGTALENTTNANIKHTFSNFGTDTVVLRATDIAGCYADTTIVISINNPPITGTATPPRGCIPTTSVLTADVSVPSNSTVTSYSWNYGDGSAGQITTANSVSHTYTTRGVFTPKLTIITSEGCNGTYSFPVVGYGTLQDSMIVYPKKEVICGSEYAVLVAKGTNATRYIWNFGDNSSVTSPDTLVVHKYKTLGVKAITVAPYDNGCVGAQVKTNVTVIGVIANYTESNTCAEKNTYSFLNNSEGNVSTSFWDFGDAPTQLNINNPSHTYPLSGKFLASMIVHDNITGCSDTIARTIYTAVPVLTGTKTTICKKDSVTFSLLNNYTDTNAVYTWNVLGLKTGPDSITSITVNNSIAGTYNNFVVINRGPRYCLDTIVSAPTFVTRGTNLIFDAPQSICITTPLTVTNNSAPFVTADTVKLYYWNFGNSALNDSSYQPAPYQYNNPGTYKLTLTAVNNAGCTDTLSKTINVNPSPFLQLVSKFSSVCPGQADTLFAISDDNVTWSPANSLSCTNCDTTVARPLASTKYFAVATNAFNCSKRDSSYISVSGPFEAPAVAGYAGICGGETAMLDAVPKGKIILWSPATGLSNPAIYNPTAAPSQTTAYRATLTDSAGCFSKTTSFIVNVNPFPVVDAGPEKFYPKGTSFSFTPTYSNNISTYSWTPPDLLNCNNCAVPVGVANFTQQYVIKVTSDSGCVAMDSVIIHTECKSSDLYLPKAFTPNNDGLNDFYYPLTKNFKTISTFIIYNRQGKIVFSGHNFTANEKSYGWNGRYKGKEQSAGTYVYMLEATCELGQKIFIQGSFILIK